jgi:DNA-binding transcriptional MocR family regulator
MSATVRRRPSLTTAYTLSAGGDELRRVIARRAVEAGCRLSADDIIVTYGCIEALNLSLRAVARPGDTVAIESPTYFLLLHVIESLGMKALEVPSHPRTGVSLDALDVAMREPQAVKALMLMPSFANPLGSVMPDEHKARAVALCEERGVALIEDDIFGETSFGPNRPLPAKAWDREGNVLLCSSFTKTLAPGLRVGWVAPGKYRKEVELLKRSTTMFTPLLPQLAIAQFVETGGYDHHLRKLRAALAVRAGRFTDAIFESFPAGCRLTRPTGGYVLWVELPQQVDAVTLFRRGCEQGVVVTPGPLFSPSKRFRNFIRISHAQDWSPATEAAIARVGRLAHELAA